MSLYNLDRVLSPESVAIIGASERIGGVGRAILDNLEAGGFEGGIYPINPKRDQVLGHRAYPSLLDIGKRVDLVVVATPITTAPDIIRQCSEIGCGGAIIVSAGGKEAGEEGLQMEALLREEAYKGRVRIVGPNCLGVINARSKLNASFAHAMPLPGKLAFISQSGAICTAVLDYAVTERIGFSRFISVGSMLDVDFGDLIDYLGNDPDVSCIMLYVENITNHRKFMSAARSVSRVKPIIVLKVGKYEAGARAAQSHTGAMTGEDAVYEAALERAGVVRVNSLEDLFGCAELVGKQPLPKGSRLGIITNAGGPGVMAADYLASFGIDPATLSSETVERMDEILPKFWSHSNPVDILGDARPELFRQAVDTCLSSGDFDAALITTTIQAMNHPTDVAKAIVPTLKARKSPVFTVWLGGREADPGRDIFNNNGIPTYDSIERAIRAFVYMYKYGRNLELLTQTPPTFQKTLDYDADLAREIIDSNLQNGQELLSETDSKKLLSAYGIPVSPTEIASNAEEAVNLAEEMGCPVVLKLFSPDITHKSDAGGVKLHLRNREDVTLAFDEIMASAKAYSPEAELTGVTVQPMIEDRDYELILGAKKDPDFGPVILFGLGGVTAELMKDRAVGLPPLDRLLARRLMEGTRAFKLLRGYRNMAPVDMEYLEGILVGLSQLVIDFPEITELDINPLIIGNGVPIGVDARILIEKTNVKSPDHLSISPYPNQYEFHETTRTGLPLFIRPIKPEDAPLMSELWSTLSPRSVYHRYLKPLRHLTRELLARSTQVDYSREMAIVALTEIEGKERIVGVARLIGHPDGHEAELGMSVGDPWHGQGVASKLLEIAVPIARERGIKQVWTQVFAENKVALALAEHYGGEITQMAAGDVYKVIVEP